MHKLKEFRDYEGVDIIDLKNPAELKTFKDYRLGKPLGKGASAIVREGIKMGTNEKVAVKMYDRLESHNQQKRENIRSEIRNLKSLDHPNIVKIMDIYEGARYVCLVMEFGGSVSLEKYVEKQKNKRLSEEQAKPLLRQLVSALAYCHRKHIFHRDLKLENILMDDKGIVKIIDFGYSVNMPDDQKSNVYCGSPAFAAPEIIKNKPYLPRYSDVWALAVIIFKMVAGFYPFYHIDKNVFCQKILQNDIYYPVYFSDQLKSLLLQMFKSNPTERVTMEEVNIDLI